jgi:hypothetical protein
MYFKFRINKELLHQWQVLQLKLKVQIKWMLKCRWKADFSSLSWVSVFSMSVISLYHFRAFSLSLHTLEIQMLCVSCSSKRVVNTQFEV